MASLSAGELREARELMDKWSAAASEDGSNDAEHEAGCDMAEFIWRLTGDEPRP
jgi:hypothetical protein